MSKQYENDRAKEIYRQTPPSVRTYRCGYSGSNAMPQPDVLITTYNGNKALELKGPIQSDRCYVDEDDLQQLVDCENANTEVYLVIKFPHYEPVVVKYYDHIVGEPEWNDKPVAEKFAAMFGKEFDARVTDSGSLSVRTPKDTDWTSTASGRDDTTTILDELGLPHEGSKHIEGASPTHPYKQSSQTA